MKTYTKVYFKHFGYTEADFVPCEICKDRATEIHHIHARSQRKDLLNDINNLMALCRCCHTEYGDKKQHFDFLKEIHFKTILIK